MFTGSPALLGDAKEIRGATSASLCGCYIIPRVSPAKGGPRKFEPAVSALLWEPIEKPLFGDLPRFAWGAVLRYRRGQVERVKAFAAAGILSFDVGSHRDGFRVFAEFLPGQRVTREMVDFLDSPSVSVNENGVVMFESEESARRLFGMPAKQSRVFRPPVM